MEVKINKEIRNYTENIYFGLSLRQFIFAVLACLTAGGLYFLFRNHLNKEILSWVCMIGAAPFVVLGFVKYNGMNAENFIVAFIKSEIITPKYLTFKPKIFYEELLKEKEEVNKNV